MILLSFCSLPWWLPWLLSFLLGLLAGWAIWAKYKSEVEGLQNDILGLKRKITSLEDDLATCQSRRAECESELALSKGRIRELETDIKASAALSASAVSGVSALDTDDEDAGKKAKGKKDKKSKKKKDKGEKDASAKVSDAGADVVSGLAGSGQVSGTDIVAGKFAAGGGSLGGGRTAMYAALKDDNLQVIEGIGPKMESVLKDNGVNTLGSLADNSADDVRGILNKYGDKYRIIDPTTWPEQAALAAGGEWDALIAMQKSLDTGRSDKATGVTDSKVEKMLIKLGVLKKWKQDDLKAVEGIGPKIEGLLHADGIKTWRALAEASVDRIKKILEAAGPRYRLADPGTWPKQAEMATDGKWDELRAYQDQLKGGKE